MEHSRGLETLVSQGSSAKEKEELNKRIEYWNTEKDLVIKEKNRVLSLFKKGFIDELEKTVKLTTQSQIKKTT